MRKLERRRIFHLPNRDGKRITVIDSGFGTREQNFLHFLFNWEANKSIVKKPKARFIFMNSLVQSSHSVPMLVILGALSTSLFAFDAIYDAKTQFTLFFTLFLVITRNRIVCLRNILGQKTPLVAQGSLYYEFLC